MFGRDRFLLVIIMAGMAIAILLVDVLAMTSLVAPMVAAPVPTRSDAAHVTTDTKYLALLIPTYSPRITRPAPTPTPTATSWLPPAASSPKQANRLSRDGSYVLPSSLKRQHKDYMADYFRM